MKEKMGGKMSPTLAHGIKIAYCVGSGSNCSPALTGGVKGGGAEKLPPNQLAIVISHG